MNHALLLQVIVGSLIGLAAGYLGSFMVLRRMALVGDALSHVALPGIAVALILHISPFIGAFAALAIAVLVIWLLEQITILPSEALVGILFTLSLAIGLLVTPQPELLEALFGDISRIGSVDVWLTVASVMVIAVVMIPLWRKLVLELVSRDLASTSGINTRLVDLLFLIAVALVVALGLKIAGTLLMGSLVIIPATAARNISRSMVSYTFTSALIGAVSAAAGILAAHAFQLSPGPFVVLVSGFMFGVSLLLKK